MAWGVKGIVVEKIIEASIAMCDMGFVGYVEGIEGRNVSNIKL